jgi:hypothetical protein
MMRPKSMEGYAMIKWVVVALLTGTLIGFCSGLLLKPRTIETIVITAEELRSPIPSLSMGRFLDGTSDSFNPKEPKQVDELPDLLTSQGIKPP